jgi:SAM-dependent methyltransferase
MTYQSESSGLGRSAQGDDFWRGTDFSGVTVILGVGGGQLARLLAPQVQRNEGTLVVIDPNLDELQVLAENPDVPEAGPNPWALIQARLRGRAVRIPLLSETVDLLVVNGILRQIPESGLPRFFEEIWQTLVPGGHLRISDILEPSEAPYNAAWLQRNRLITSLSRGLNAAAATGVDLRRAAQAARAAGLEDLSVAILPGYALTDAWLEETIEAVRAMASRVGDPYLRQQIVEQGLPRLVSAYQQGDQRAAERFVIKGVRPGDLALDMEASFTEEDLIDLDDDVDE